MIQVSKDLKNVDTLMLFVLQYCLDMKMHTEDAMAPFSLFLDSLGSQSLHILDNEGANSKDELFDKAIRQSRPTTAIFAMESSMNIGGKVMPAILLKLYEKNKPEMVIFAQAYRTASPHQSFVKVGHLQMMSTIPNHHYTRRMFSFDSLISFFF